jgi:glycosyltransferase involved in cell wall biosynthesis
MARVLLAFEPPDGGVAMNVAQLALGLGALGWKPEVAGPPNAIPYPELERSGIPVHRLPLGRGYGRPDADASALARLTALLRGRDFDLIHCHASKVGAIGRVAALATRTPSLYSPHCFPFAGELHGIWPVASKLIERALGRLPGEILCVCESERQLALREGIAPAKRLHMVHNGCEPCPEGLAPEPSLAALAARGPLVGAVAALRNQKRLDVLIDATPMILARVPEAGVAIVGNGPLHEQLRARAARIGLDAEPRFALLPFTPPAARALAALDVFVLPSSWEAFPIGVLEALACGVPQVVSDVGGSREAVTPQTGMLVEPEDPLALAEAIVAMLDDGPRREEAARASRKRHAEHFGIARMIAQTAAAYEAVVTGGRLPA